jgi:predicted acyltransferase
VHPDGWAVLSTGPLEPPEATVAAAVDRAVLGTNHIWSSSKTWDPEGPLSTIPAVATAMCGILAAAWVKQRRVKALALAGAIGIVAGLAWDPFFPINKNLWTSSYVVFSAGCAAVLLAGCIWLIDLRGVQGWTRPFVIYGINPLIAFVGSGMMARLLSIIKVGDLSLQAWTFRTFFKPYFSPHLASLLWALAFVAIWLTILALLHRRNIVVKL